MPGTCYDPGGTARMLGVSGVILAGGRSRRMGGQPKALLLVDGRPLIGRVVEAVRAALPECLIVTNTPDVYAFLGLPMVPDVFAEGGALGGIYSGLAAAPGAAAFAVACDMPFLSVALIQALAARAGEADVVIPEAGGELQTLHAVYGKACLLPMERRLRQGRLRVAGFFDEVRVLRVPAEAFRELADPAVVFTNVNTPEDLDRARARGPRG